MDENKYERAPCVKCGGTWFYKSHNSCVACNRLRSRKWHHNNYVSVGIYRKYDTDDILKFIIDSWQENGFPPTIREICRGCNISSTSVVSYHLDILERRGEIERNPAVSRGIRLCNWRVVLEPVAQEKLLTP